MIEERDERRKVRRTEREADHSVIAYANRSEFQRSMNISAERGHSLARSWDPVC
jgi:hypothetical protein